MSKYDGTTDRELKAQLAAQERQHLCELIISDWLHETTELDYPRVHALFDNAYRVNVYGEKNRIIASHFMRITDLSDDDSLEKLVLDFANPPVAVIKTKEADHGS